MRKGRQEGERSLEEFVGDVHFRRGAAFDPSANMEPTNLPGLSRHRFAAREGMCFLQESKEFRNNPCVFTTCTMCVLIRVYIDGYDIKYAIRCLCVYAKKNLPTNHEKPDSHEYEMKKE